ncbi:MAG: carboxypeptidase-like regulatory domain-containing protein, partial [Bacteroidia bacterium]|nr:carboxypeptidase-like regulatory domain-containing protein [Bacteroidia bacterium]
MHYYIDYTGRLCITLAALFAATTLRAQKTDSTKKKSAFVVKGNVSTEAGEGLPGAYVSVKGTVVGALSDVDGSFVLRLDRPGKYEVQCILAGYAEETAVLDSGQTTLHIVMTPERILSNEVVVSASRTGEKLLESPVTIEKMDLLHLKESPAVSMFDAVAALKGVDVQNTSLGWRTVNTRGFNSPANPRFQQRLDGMDMQATGLSAPAGLLASPSDLDVESIEIIPGAQSGLYGPNAFNGVMTITTKSPFQYPGLSVMLGGGANHLDGVDRPAALIGEAALRYARVFKDRLGVKLNLAYFAGEDWHASSREDIADYSGTVNLQSYAKGPGNPGYNGLNIYGDEVSNVFDSLTTDSPFGPLIRKPLRISRTGYLERDLADYNTYVFKSDVQVHFKINENVELIGGSRYSNGTAIFTADNRIAIRNFHYAHPKLELRGGNYFFRAYASMVSSGNSYDVGLAAINVNRAWKGDAEWFTQYLMVYSGQLLALNNPLLGLNLGLKNEDLTPQSDEAARRFADSDNSFLAENPRLRAFLESVLGAEGADTTMKLFRGKARFLPGTPEFNAAKAKVVKSSDWNRDGAYLFDRSNFYNADVQYDFSKHWKVVEFLAGGTARAFVLNSRGLIYGDYQGPIWVPEFGAYLQATKRFFQERLRITGSIRVDKAHRFKPVVSPRAAVVFAADRDKKHNLRASYQTGFRMPDLRHRYIDMYVGIYKFIGGFTEDFYDNGVIYNAPGGERIVNAYTYSSVKKFWDTGDETVLVKQDMSEIRPEFVRSIEAGYKGAVLPNLVVDVNGYVNLYRDFIGMVTLIGPHLDDVGTPDMPLTPAKLRVRGRNADTIYTQYRR